jgi:hypothetical protein
MMNKEHWFVWYGARLIPQYFSNLGRFNIEQNILSPIDLGTNVTRGSLIGLGVLCVNDHLTITL